MAYSMNQVALSRVPDSIRGTLALDVDRYFPA